MIKLYYNYIVQGISGVQVQTYIFSKALEVLEEPNVKWEVIPRSYFNKVRDTMHQGGKLYEI